MNKPSHRQDGTPQLPLWETLGCQDLNARRGERGRHGGSSDFPAGKDRGHILNVGVWGALGDRGPGPCPGQPPTKCSPQPICLKLGTLAEEYHWQLRGLELYLLRGFFFFFIIITVTPGTACGREQELGLGPLESTPSPPPGPCFPATGHVLHMEARGTDE